MINRLKTNGWLLSRVCAMGLALALLGVSSPVSLAQPDIPPTLVETLTVSQTTTRPSVVAVGTLKARHGIVVRSEVPGRITHIYFKSGQTVKAGTPLVQLNPEIVSAQQAVIKTRLALSEKTAQRYKKLVKTNVISKEDYDKIMATLAQDKAALAEATARLAQTTITAAFDGKVGLRQVSEGDYVQAGQALVNLSSQDPIMVEFPLPENQLRKVRLGQTVRVRVDAYPGRVFSGKVTATEATIDATTRTLRVQASIANPKQLLLPGAYASVDLDLNQAKDVIMVPQAAVLYRVGQAYVYRVIDQKATQTPVTLGTKSAGQVEIVSGLNVGDEIITAGQHKLMPGAPVMKLGAKPAGGVR